VNVGGVCACLDQHTGGRGCNPVPEGLALRHRPARRPPPAAGADGGLRAGRCRLAGRLRLRGDDLP